MFDIYSFYVFCWNFISDTWQNAFIWTFALFLLIFINRNFLISFIAVFSLLIFIYLFWLEKIFVSWSIILIYTHSQKLILLFFFRQFETLFWIFNILAERSLLIWIRKCHWWVWIFIFECPICKGLKMIINLFVF